MSKKSQVMGKKDQGANQLDSGHFVVRKCKNRLTRKGYYLRRGKLKNRYKVEATNEELKTHILAVLPSLMG